MNPKLQASFIPKDRDAHLQRKARVRRGFGILAFFSTTLLVLALLASLGAFFYRQYLEKNIDLVSAELVQREKSFETSLITELERVDTKIEIAKKILSKHVAPSVLFSTLEALTVQNVTLLSLEVEAVENGDFELVAVAQAPSYASVALQSEVLKNDKTFKKVELNNFNLNTSGVISFSMRATVDRNSILYSNTITSQLTVMSQE